MLREEKSPLQVSASNTVDITYSDCSEGDLAAQFKATHPSFANAIDEHLVGEGGCADDLTKYLNDEQFLVAGIHATKYKDITEADDGRLSLAKVFVSCLPRLMPR